MQIRDAQDLLFVSVGQGLRIIEDMNITELRYLPLIDFQQNIHQYESVAFIINQEHRNHYWTVIPDWETDSCTELESIISGLANLPGEAKRHLSLDWYKELMNK